MNDITTEILPNGDVKYTSDSGEVFVETAEEIAQMNATRDTIIPVWEKVFEGLKKATNALLPIEERRAGYGQWIDWVDEYERLIHPDPSRFTNNECLLCTQEGFNEFYEMREDFRHLHERRAQQLFPKPEIPPPDRLIKSFHISGDILITDPCYIEDWITPQNVEWTLCGDWSCELIKGTDEVIGMFGADGGQVSVTNLTGDHNENGLKNWASKNMWLGTVIEGFEGDIEYFEHYGEYEWWGGWFPEKALVIRGKGTKNGHPYEFHSRVVGF